MAALAARGTHGPVNSIVPGLIIIPFTFTTGAATGTAPTLSYTYGGNISIALTEGTPDLFVIDIGSYKQFLTVLFDSTLEATVNDTPTGDAAAGTVTMSVTADALASATVSGIICILK